MATIKRQTMPTTIQNIKAEDFLQILQEKFSVSPKQKLKITFEVIKPAEEKNNDDSNFEEFEVENLGDSVIENLKEIVEAKRKGVRLPNARDLLNEL